MKKRNYSCMGWPGSVFLLFPFLIRAIPLLFITGCTVDGINLESFLSLGSFATRTASESNYHDWIVREARLNKSMDLNYNGDIHIPTIQLVAKCIDECIEYKSDIEVWGKTEYWQTSYQTHTMKTGDCEDKAWYAIKLMIDNGVPSAYTGCLFMLVWDDAISEYIGHMVAFFINNGEMFILDYGELHQASQITNIIPCAIMNYYNYEWIMRRDDEKYFYSNERSTNDTEITGRIEAFKISIQNWMVELGL